ncbi:SDR family oxidoreductase [Candidatus Pelagibacter ubique]|uniref:SDR family oxidoreductase n=1 Tax=Pelagibacter ubique TaxID=198252 RepID=UPI0003C7FDEB
MFDLNDKNILITGAGGLLGGEFTKSLIQSGANCFVIDIDQKKINKLKARFNNEELNRFNEFNIDISNKNKLLKLNEHLNKKKIFINTIINNAANNPPPSIRNKDVWKDDLEISLTSVKNIIEIFSKNMINNKGGNIINIASDLSIIAPDQRIYSNIKNYTKPVSYSVTKHGIVGLTKYYASLLGKDNIRCNSLSPGGVFHNQNKNFVKKICRLIPLGRMANKKEYNGIIVFLCSDASEYMTGHNLIADGGRTII